MKHKQIIDKVLYWVLVVLMALMVLNVLWQVASRYIVQSPSTFTDELSRYLLIWVSILGASYVTGQKMHLAIDIFPNSLKGEKQKRLNVFINAVVALFAFFAMVWGGFNLVYITLKLEQTSASLGIPLGFVYLVIPISGMLIIYYSITNLFEKNTEPEEVGDQMA